jgi:hypothetical protein
LSITPEEKPLVQSLKVLQDSRLARRCPASCRAHDNDVRTNAKDSPVSSGCEMIPLLPEEIHSKNIDVVERNGFHDLCKNPGHRAQFGVILV